MIVHINCFVVGATGWDEDEDSDSDGEPLDGGAGGGMHPHGLSVFRCVTCDVLRVTCDV